MATVLTISHDASLLNGSNSGQRGYVGVMSGNWVMRYKFTTPSTGYVSSLLFRSYWYHTAGFNFSTYPVRAYVTTSSTSHNNANSGSTYSASMYAETSGSYNVAVNITGLTLPPSTTYYIYLFPGYTASYRYSAHNYSAGQTIYLEASVATESSMTASNGTLGTAQTITVTKKISSYTHTITYTCGTASGTICTKSSSTSISFTPPLSLASQNVNGTSVTVKLSLQTYSGDTAIGSAVTKTLSMAIPASVKPECHIVVEDATGYSDRFGGYIQGRSKAEITVSATLAYGSAIQKKTITFDGKTYTTNGTTSVISGSGTLTINASVTDGRSRTGSASKDITVLPYTAPTVSKLTVGRCDADGTANDMGSYAKVLYSYSIHALSNQNDKGAAIQYKKAVDTTWTTIGLDSVYSVADATYIFAADDGSSYDVRLVITDYFEEVTRSTSVSTASVIMHLKENGKGISFGKISEKDAIEFGWKAFDRFGTSICNGLAEYGGSANMINADTTLEQLIITTVGTPDESLWYVQTMFYDNKSTNSNRAQLAYPYRWAGNIWYRYYNSGAWSDWIEFVQKTELLDLIYPVNSVYISYSHTSPAELFGGTWHRMQSRFLWGTTTDGTIGATAGASDVTLTTNQIPAHYHTQRLWWTGYDGWTSQTTPQGVYVFNRNTTVIANTNSASITAKVNLQNSHTTASTGGGASHTNMPPYVNVAIWRRTA